MTKMTPLETLQQLRKGYPTPMAKAELGALINAVAWAHRADGYGVLSKPTGNNCPQPLTGELISCDILALKDGRIFDALIDAERRAEPTWGPKKPVAANRWRAPVSPEWSVTLDQPGVVDVPPVAPVVPYNEQHSVVFGRACNDAYSESGATPDPGMIAVYAQRAAWDYYVGGMSWEASLAKHRLAFRAQYGLK